jgi:hypothetical protein
VWALGFAPAVKCLVLRPEGYLGLELGDYHSRDDIPWDIGSWIPVLTLDG